MDKKYGLTKAGFVKKDFLTCYSEISESFKNKINQNIDLSPTSVFGNIIGIYAERESLLWDGLQELSTTMNPNNATGIPLQNAISINGISKQEATASKVILTFYGKTGIKIPSGTGVAIPETSYQFNTKIDAVVAQNGIVEIEAECSILGEVKALAGTINKILNPIYNIESCTNKKDAVVGQFEETEEDLKIRRLQLLQRAGSATEKGIRAAIQKIEGVKTSILLNAEIANYIPSGSIHLYVEGGEPLAIANAINSSRGGGCLLYLDESSIKNTIKDSQGIDRIISFSRPKEKIIYLSIALKTNSDFPSNGYEQVKNAIIDYANKNLTIGKSLINSSLYVPINSVSGIIGIQIYQDLLPNPSNTLNISVEPIEYAKLDTSRINFIDWKGKF
ncbi:hypothetical protein GCL60_16605 [Silvanigrella paludirubra]|uniref:Baseplate protein J-like barrel domain-containing protein n=1 Tax=Silvanigrella paludirubra TaxID=2499159 RepID=A0A6N6VQB7_9BACT|nr:baseplate J/gp47 family protein [Silvanigrella paludirubra]KAB8035850.1 hypothetical protein GCL60_16605 [Silvanigrella paludirubra]